MPCAHTTACSSYWTEYHSAILDPATVVLVAEDWVHHSEGDHVYPALRKAVTYSPGARAVGSKAVVGVASVAIKPGSPYIGLFQPTGNVICPLTPSLVLALDQPKALHFSPPPATSHPIPTVTCARTGCAYMTRPPPRRRRGTHVHMSIPGYPGWRLITQSRHLAGQMRLSTLAVHPQVVHRPALLNCTDKYPTVAIGAMGTLRGLSVGAPVSPTWMAFLW